MDSTTAEAIGEIIAGCTVDEERYRRYMERTSWRIEADRDFLAQSIPNLGDVLDVGAVPPLLAALLLKLHAGSLTIMDPNVDHFAPYCERHGITTVHAGLQQISGAEPGRTFDLVCLCEVLEHLTGDIPEVLRRVGSWVKPGGHLYLTTPNLRSVTGAVAIFLRGSGVPSKSLEPITNQYTRAKGPYGYYGHVREYTPKEVRDLLAPTGFTHVASRFQAHPRAETFSAQAIRLIERMAPPLRLYGKYLFRKSA